MKGNLKNILPVLCSIIIFSSVFILVSLRNTKIVEEELQLSPKSHLYKDKFGEPAAYSEKDISSNAFVKNIRVNEIGGASEPKIVCNPKNKSILAVASNDFSAKKNICRIFISEDGGLNWQPKEINLSSKFKESSYSDPWIDFDHEGNLYFVAVQNDLTKAGREGIYFSKSADNGSSWKTDIDFVDYNGKENIHLDRPKIYVTKSDSKLNSIYVSWIEVKGFTTFIMLSKSNDGGITFAHPTEVVKNGAEYCSIVCDLRGDLFLTYLEDEEKVTVIKSTDEGTSWSKAIGSVKIIPAGTKSENQFVIKQHNDNSIRINSEPSVASNGKEILITYSASGVDKDLSDIYFTKFNFNTGEMMSPVKVNSDKTHNDQFLPSITSDESDNVFIVYQDSRNDVGNILTETFISVSEDGGLTFKDEKLSTASYNPLSVAVDRYFGDYNSCVISGDKFIGVWTDGRNNNLDIYAGIFDLKEFIGKKNN